MSEAESFERIVASLHEAALDPARWSGASMLIDQALRAHGSSMVMGDGDFHEDARFSFAWYFFRGQPHREICREYFQVYYRSDERRRRAAQLPDSQLFHVTDLYTEEELKTSAAYNELLVRTHAGNGINVRLNGPNGTHIIWGINDPIDGDGWSSAQLGSIRRLLPHVRQAVHVQQALSGAALRGASLTALLETTGLGIIQLDARGRIAAANDRALSLLRSGDGLLDEGGSLSARSPEDNAHLRTLLARALPPFGAQGVGGSTTVKRAGSLLPLVLHVNPLSPEGGDFQVWPAGALALVVDPANGIHIDPEVAAAALDLTPMEGRVAVLLTQGMSVHQIAASTGRKESTIRSHVKHVFAKHGLTRQAELVRLVQSLAGAPGAPLRG